MGFRHNNVLHANHFRKDWQRRVRTWFDQPGRKLRRRNARKAKATALGVRPLTLLRPAVRAQTVRYNRKVREGRGFTFAELKEAGIGRKEARGVGIVVDHRRRNLSEEGKLMNVKRLKAYKERLIVFPRNAKKPKKGDSTVSNCPFSYFHSLRLTRTCRAILSRPRPHGSLSPCPRPSLTRHPAKLPTKNASSRPTEPSATPVPYRGTKALAKSGKPRRQRRKQTRRSKPYLSFLLSPSVVTTHFSWYSLKKPWVYTHMPSCKYYERVHTKVLPSISNMLKLNPLL